VIGRAWRRWRGPVHNSTAAMGCASAIATVFVIGYLVYLAVAHG
jgi:uncharacterized membrane protein YozB (DUF420 family)